jgi:hypothetical protein
VTAESVAQRSVPSNQPGWLGRFIDRGAVFAGYVGLGMAIVIAIAFELIVAVQPLVFIVAPIAGLIIGGYANQRSERWRPMKRVFANAAWAGLVSGLGLALIYVALRLLFIYADAGSLPTGAQLSCRPGPDCTYLRYVADGRAAELASYGVTDGASFGAFALREQANGGALIVLFTLSGSLVAAGIRSLRAPSTPT